MERRSRSRPQVHQFPARRSHGRLPFARNDERHCRVAAIAQRKKCKCERHPHLNLPSALNSQLAAKVLAKRDYFFRASLMHCEGPDSRPEEGRLSMKLRFAGVFPYLVTPLNAQGESRAASLPDSATISSKPACTVSLHS